MAFARDQYTASAAQTAFSITFGYLASADVVVRVNGVVKALSTDYTLTSGGTVVTFNSGLDGGDTVLITRETSQDARVVDYTVPGTLTESDLDNDSFQAFFMAQEALDEAAKALQLDNTTLQYSAGSLRITNVSTPTDDTDAANKAYVDAKSVTAGNVPTPNDPDDNGKVLTANGGTWSWETP